VLSVIDKDGFRSNVGIILCNARGELLWARRIGQEAWQFPQGGIKQGENPEQALYRELKEEIGLQQSDVKLLAKTKRWLKYKLPEKLVRHDLKPVCYGQKQIWFLLQIKTEDIQIKLDVSEKPEFDNWKWVNYWFPLKEVVSFKRAVYQSALKELEPCLQPINKSSVAVEPR